MVKCYHLRFHFDLMHNFPEKVNIDGQNSLFLNTRKPTHTLQTLYTHFAFTLHTNTLFTHMSHTLHTLYTQFTHAYFTHTLDTNTIHTVFTLFTHTLYTPYTHLPNTYHKLTLHRLCTQFEHTICTQFPHTQLNQPSISA